MSDKNQNLFPMKFDTQRIKSFLSSENEKEYSKKYHQTPDIKETEDQKLKKGDIVVMVNCGEAKKYQGFLWICTDDSYQSSSGTELVFLKDFSGAFSVECLQKIDKRCLNKFATCYV